MGRLRASGIVKAESILGEGDRNETPGQEGEKSTAQRKLPGAQLCRDTAAWRL